VPRVLSETEFNAIKSQVLSAATENLSEQDFYRWAGPRMAAAIGKAENLPAKPEGSAAGRFISGAADVLNPVALVEGVAGAVRHPINTATALVGAQVNQGRQAIDLAKQGRYTEAVGHGVAAAVPLLGPAAAEAGEQIASGDVAGGLGKGAGLLVPALAPTAVRGVVKATRALPEGAATALERGATARAVETMAPQVGPNKVRLGNLAAKVGPEVLENTSAVTRTGMLDQAASKLSDSYAALDAAYDAVPNTRQYITAPIKAGLQREISSLSVQGIGGTVEPATRASRIASLRQALEEVKGLGNFANVDNLRKLRIAWDEGAQAVFTPSVAQDFLKARASGSGWADARTVLNDYLTSQHPELKPLNADASLWKKAVDVMQAAEESDRVRPKVGRTLMARGLGAATGGAAQGPIGAFVGAVVGPGVEQMMSNLRPGVKIVVGRQMAKLATAIRSGDVPAITNTAQSLRQLIAQQATLAGRTTSPSESQTQPAPALPQPLLQPSWSR
jgi:hypothetical protein